MSSTRTGAPPRTPSSTTVDRRRRLAALVAFVLGVTALASAFSPVGTAGAQVPPPTIAVSKTSGISEAGETLTVTGSGFDPAANIGTRPPLAGQPSGVYVTFGRFTDPWRPSEGASSANREVLVQKWALPAASRAILDPTGTNPDIILLNADGTFTATLPVAPGGTTAGQYAIATYPGSGAVNAAQEVLTPISFAPPQEWEAQIAVSKTTGIASTGETITVTGSGFDPSANIGTRPPLAGQPSGVYVAFGRFGDPWRPSEGAPSANREVLVQKWALPQTQKDFLDPEGTNPDIILLEEDGTFQADVAVAPGGTTAGQYAIAVYPGAGAANADQELLTPLAFAPPAPVFDPAIAVSKTANIDEAGETVTVAGSGFDPAANVGTRPPLAGQPAGVYVTFGRFTDPWQPSSGAPAANREVLVQKWALPAAQRAILDPSGTSPDLVTLEADGSFSVDLPVAPGGTTAGQYAIATYAASGAVNAEHELLTPVSFAAETPDTPGTGTGTGGQVLTVTPSTDLDPDGQTLDITGTGYDPAVGIYVALCVDNGPNLPPSPCLGGSGEGEESSSSAWITDDARFANLRTAPFGPGGSFGVTIEVAASDEFMDCYDPDTTCVLASRADHTRTTDRSADVKIPLYFEGQIPPENPEPPATPDTTAAIDRTTVVAGEAMTASGEGFIPGEQVQVWLHSDPQLMGVAVADALGAVSYTFTVPATTPAGTHHIELYGITSALRLVSPSFTVIAAAVPDAVAAAATPPTPVAVTTTTTGTLPVTGSSVALPLVGVALLAVGLALAGPARRRSRPIRTEP